MTKLVDDLVQAFSPVQKAEGNLEQAKEQAKEAQNSSLRSLAEKLHGYNEDLDKNQISEMAGEAAEKIANGNPNILKVRKSEFKLLLEQRSHLQQVITELDEHVERWRDAYDGDYTLNIRAESLKALRKLRKDKTLTPKKYVEELEAKKTHEPTPQEKAAKALDRLTDGKAWRQERADGTVIHDPRALYAFELLRAVISSGPQVDPEIPSYDEVLGLDEGDGDEEGSEEGFTEIEAPADDVEELAAEIEELESSADDDDDDDEFDFDEIMSEFGDDSEA